MKILELIRTVVLGHRALGRRPRENPKRREIEQHMIRGVPACYWFGYWTHVGVDPDGRTRLRWKWFHFNPHTGRWT